MQDTLRDTGIETGILFVIVRITLINNKQATNKQKMESKRKNI